MFVKTKLSLQNKTSWFYKVVVHHIHYTHIQFFYDHNSFSGRFGKVPREFVQLTTIYQD